MGFRRAPMALSWRIVASVALGLGAILLLYGFVALWTIRQSTEVAYAERVDLAEAVARHVDEVLDWAIASVEQGARTVKPAPGQELTAEDLLHLVDLRHSLGSGVSLTLSDGNGKVLWQERDGTADGVLVGECAARGLQGSGPRIMELAPSGDGAAACIAIPMTAEGGVGAGSLTVVLDPNRERLRLLPFGEVGDGKVLQLISSTGRTLAGTGPVVAAARTKHQILLGGLIQAGASGYRIHEPESGESFPSHLVAYAPVKTLPGWGIEVEQPRGIVVQAPQRQQDLLVAFGVLALMLAILVAWLDARRVVRPLRALTLAAERFAAGDLEQPVSTTDSGELGVLALAFETMRGRLRASLAQLEAWNRELEERVAARECERDRLLRRLMVAQEDERKRVAQELHDETSQALSSLQLGLERLEAGIADPAHARRLACELRSVAGAALSEVHRLAVELRPSVLDDLGLVVAIRRCLQECAEQQGMVVDFAAVGVEHLRLRPEAESAVYRVVQAAVTNVRQHSRAHHVNVLLERRGARLVVVVEDDGQGYDPVAVRVAPLEARLGLVGMEERASLLEAALTVETAPGAGCTVFLEVPLEGNICGEEVDGEVPTSTR